MLTQRELFSVHGHLQEASNLSLIAAFTDGMSRDFYSDRCAEQLTKAAAALGFDLVQQDDGK